MKKKYQFLFIALVLVYFIGSVLVPRVQLANWQIYSNELQTIGWKKHAADHIAKVEFKLIPEDSLYISYMED